MMLKHFKAVGIAASFFLVIWVAIAYLPKPYEFFGIKPRISADCIKVAVIYAKRIKTEAGGYKLFEESFDKERDILYQEILEKEKQLRDEELELKKLSKIKNKDKLKYQKIYAQFREKVETTENELQSKKEGLLKKANATTQKLEEDLNKIIESIIKEFEFNLVLNADLDDKRLVMYADKRFDITDEIIKRLNRKQ